MNVIPGSDQLSPFSNGPPKMVDKSTLIGLQESASKKRPTFIAKSPGLTTDLTVWI